MLGIPDSVMPHVRRFGFSGAFAVGIVAVMLMGINPVTVLTGQVAEPHPLTTLTGLEALETGEATPTDFIHAVEREVNGYWQRAFKQASIRYPEPELRIVETAADFGCGMAGSGIGTFYCPEDGRVFVDLAAYERLRAAFPDGANEAQGYLVARAYGHHAQNALGLLETLAAARQTLSAEDLERQEQRYGAQAACHAAIWVKFAGLDPLLDEPEMVAAIDSVRPGAAITQMPSRQGLEVPETFTRPSDAFRKLWFDKGYAIPAGGTCRLDKIGQPT